MANSYSGSSEADSVVAAATRVRELAERLALDADDFLSVTRISSSAGVPVDIIRALLAGRAAEQRDLTAVFTSRCQDLKKRRRVASDAIGQALGVSGSHAHYLITGKRKASMEQCVALAAFFDVRAQYLTATDHDAVLDLLRDDERRMLEELAAAEPAPAADAEMARLLNSPGIRSIAARAADLDPERRRALAAWVDGYVAGARSGEEQ
ncbi:hypothetical protein ACFTXJ_00360 [Streptomyces zhihengii]|uniref:hypothetical protein n=1 Tax=Streptomyces zhihengii TaxID=1818004 RepID=UPI00363F4295